MPRNPKGSGTIRKKTVTRNGKEYTYFEARYSAGRDPGTGKQIQRSITAKTQKEAAEKLREATAALDAGTYTAPSGLTVGQWLDIWQRDYLGDVKPKTVVAYEKDVRVHIAPALGAVKLTALDTPTIQHFYNTLNQSLAPKTVHCIHGVLHKALQQAVEIKYIKFNPSDACKLPKVEKKEIKPLGSAGITAFLEAARGDSLETVLVTMLFTGIRRSEVAGLTWDIVDLDRGTITINKQLQNVDGSPGEYRLVSTKSTNRRIIALPPFIVELLRRHRVRQMEWRLQAGSCWEDGNYVFTNSFGHHISPHTVYHHLKRIAASIGMPEARLHDLRHSYAVASLQAGDDIKTLQGNLGHATAAFTLDRYGHVIEEMRQASAARMEDYIQNLKKA